MCQSTYLYDKVQLAIPHLYIIWICYNMLHYVYVCKDVYIIVIHSHIHVSIYPSSWEYRTCCTASWRRHDWSGCSEFAVSAFLPSSWDGNVVTALAWLWRGMPSHGHTATIMRQSQLVSCGDWVMWDGHLALNSPSGTSIYSQVHGGSFRLHIIGLVSCPCTDGPWNCAGNSEAHHEGCRETGG